MFAMLQTKNTKLLKPIASLRKEIPVHPPYTVDVVRREGQPITPEHVVDDKGMGRPPKARPQILSRSGVSDQISLKKKEKSCIKREAPRCKVHLRKMTASDWSVDDLRN